MDYSVTNAAACANEIASGIRREVNEISCELMQATTDTICMAAALELAYEKWEYDCKEHRDEVHTLYMVIRNAKELAKRIEDMAMRADRLVAQL